MHRQGLSYIEGIERAKRPGRIPIVISRAETGGSVNDLYGFELKAVHYSQWRMEVTEGPTTEHRGHSSGHRRRQVTPDGKPL